MKQLLVYTCLASIFTLTTSLNKFKGNEVKGKITMSSCPKFVLKGKGYNKDGTEVMHSDDPLAKPERNVIISLHPINFQPQLRPTGDAYITQVEQTFLPHVLPVTVGSKVHFLNEDEFFHNVQSFTRGSRFSIGRRAPGISYSVKIKKKGIVSLMCNIHSHMGAKILSLDTPYFCRINEDGTYSMKNLPDGKYRLEVFHPNCENQSEEIDIKGNQVFQHNFDLSTRS